MIEVHRGYACYFRFGNLKFLGESDVTLKIRHFRFENLTLGLNIFRQKFSFRLEIYMIREAFSDSHVTNNFVLFKALAVRRDRDVSHG